MGKTTGIEWTDSTWNPVTGCAKISPGCANCYAERLSKRFRKDWKPWTANNARHNIRLNLNKREDPFRWYEPRMVFVCSMADLFHADVPDEFVADMFGIMAAAHWHTYQVLTKRVARMLDFLRTGRTEAIAYADAWRVHVLGSAFRCKKKISSAPIEWPPKNIWFGASAEDQKRLEERVIELVDVPGDVRFLSLEPLLEPVDLEAAAGRHIKRIDWVIVGGESGPNARHMRPEWVRPIRDTCAKHGIPFFFKQWGAWVDREQMPDDLYRDIDAAENLAGHPQRFWNVGKKRAGALLDGVEHREAPVIESRTGPPWWRGSAEVGNE